MNILIREIDILKADGFIKNGYIGIKNGCIEFVGKCCKEDRDFKPDRIIEGKHLLAMPGLINTHTHCAMTLFRNFADDIPLEEWLFNKIFPAEEKLSPDDVYWGSLLGIAEMFKSGTTAFADMYLHMDMVAQAVCESGIRANLSRSPFRFNRGENLKRVDEIEDCYSYYKNWNNSKNSRIRVYVEVHSAYLYDEETLKSAACIAKELGTGIHIHILETVAEREQSIKRYGMDSALICDKVGIFDVPVIAAHCVHLDKQDIDILMARGVNVAHNPSSNLKLGSGIAKIPDIISKGINVSLGTDGAASNNNLNMFEEMHIASLIHKGVHRNPELMSAKQVFDMATINGAKAIGFGAESGSIEEGMKADIILVNTDKPHMYPLNNPFSTIVYSAQASDVDTVIVDGKIVMENRELTTIDEEMVKHKAAQAGKRIMGGM